MKFFLTTAFLLSFIGISDLTARADYSYTTSPNIVNSTYPEPMGEQYLCCCPCGPGDVNVCCRTQSIDFCVCY